MSRLDTLAYANPWRGRHPGEKALLSLGLLLCAVALPPWPGAPVVGGVVVLLVLGPAGLRPADAARALRGPAGFVLVGALPLLVAVGGPSVVRWEPAGLPAALEVVGRSTVAILCLLLFAATTPLADVLPRLSRLGVPTAVSEVAGLIYRMLFLLLDTAQTVREAQAGRLGFRTWATSYRSVAGQAGAVFVRSFDRARRLEEGLALRGYDGELRVDVEVRAVSRPFVAATVVLLVGVVTVSLVLRALLT